MKNNLLVWLLTAGLVACGGGGGGGSSAGTAPVASASSASSSSNASSAASSSATSSAASSTSASSVPSGFGYYTANALPTAAGSVTLGDGTTTQFSLCTSVGCNASYASVSSGVLTVDTTSSTAVSEQSYFQLNNAFSTGGYPKSATVVARIRGNSVASLRSLSIDAAFSEAGQSGPRVHTQLLPNNFVGGLYMGSMNPTSGTADLGLYSSDFDTTTYHVVQLTFSFTSATSGTMTVYLDGNATPIATQTLTGNFPQATAVGQNYLRIGEETTTEHAKGDVNWIVWTSDAAYTPAQINGRLPAALGPVPGYMGWSLYTGDLLPTTATAVSLADGSTTQFSLCTSVGCNASYASVSSGVLTVDTTSSTAVSEQSYFQLNNAFSTGGYPKSATVVARIRGNSVASLRSLSIDAAFSEAGQSGPRVHTQLLPNNFVGGLYMGNMNPTSGTADLGLYSSDFDTTTYHVVQLTFSFTSATSGTMTVYLDGNATPIATQTLTGDFPQATAVGQNYLRIGEETTTEHAKGDVDWIVWTLAAYTPAQLSGLLPAALGTVSGY
ncbi:MAG: hypothetical protein QM776_09130 [Rhodocyclaceae bacterium]